MGGPAKPDHLMIGLLRTERDESQNRSTGTIRCFADAVKIGLLKGSRHC